VLVEVLDGSEILARWRVSRGRGFASLGGGDGGIIDSGGSVGRGFSTNGSLSTGGLSSAVEEIFSAFLFTGGNEGRSLSIGCETVRVISDDFLSEFSLS
jgi:hypothetical protein